tara:strand:- start:2148 stop:2405 length:258 start_codon:yes stop_codon:yes gene_type:complete
MKLTNKEKSWHDKHGSKVKESIMERNKNFKSIDPYSKEGMLRQKKSHEEHGRAWWIFSGLSAPKKYEKTWIEQFRKGRFEDASKE